jgi:lipopolysaccharide export system permease protein
MKLIDKYILLNILVPLIYCLLAFLMLFVIFDLFSHMSDFIEAETPLPSVFRYYAFLIPSVVIFIVPISLLLAILYGLSQLTRNNELTAMRASGVSLYRLMTPIIIVGFAASLLVGAINETIAPWSAYWTDQFVRAEKHDGEVSFHITQNLPYRNPTHHRVWMVGEFDRETYDMRRVEVIQQREDGTDEARILARSARWLDGQWWFLEVTTQQFDEYGYPFGPPVTSPRRQMVEFTETPRDFINVVKDPEFLSSRELLAFIHAHQHVSRDTLAIHEVNLHYRLAMPWTCFIVTLLGLPIGAHTGRKGAFRGIALALGLFFTFYVLINFGMALGKNQTLVPWLSVWRPNILFLIIGIVLVQRMR